MNGLLGAYLPGPFLAAGAVGLAGWSLGALSPGGAVAAGLVGGTVLARGGLPAAGALVAFFVTSSALGRYKARAKARRGVLAQAKGGRRDAWQVLANGGAGAVALALGGRRAAPAFLGALATAGADTWATELGLLASGPPRLLTTLRPVAPGTSGAVTPQGTLAAVGGALTVGATWGVVQALERRLAPQRAQGGLEPAGRAVPLAVVTGTAGAFVDSLLGATVQGAYWCPTCQEPLEVAQHPRCGGRATLVRGWPWLTNDAVNALATATGAVLGATLAGALAGGRGVRGRGKGQPPRQAPALPEV
ncbi:MAG TPA: DUF92 domain-containing protein [Chloroflexota bacterium]|nr:DUF92 domain-containing protein [Chloroflexota bacterium]